MVVRRAVRSMVGGSRMRDIMVLIRVWDGGWLCV